MSDSNDSPTLDIKDITLSEEQSVLPPTQKQLIWLYNQLSQQNAVLMAQMQINQMIMRRLEAKVTDLEQQLADLEIEKPPEVKTFKIGSVIVRQIRHKGKGDHPDKVMKVVDCYVPWNDQGTFGEHKVGTLYLDDENDYVAFFAASGLNAHNLPFSIMPSPYRRIFGQPPDPEVDGVTEVPVKREFELQRTKTGEKVGKDGKKSPKYSYEIVGVNNE